MTTREPTIDLPQILASLQSVLPRIYGGESFDDYTRQLHVVPEGLRKAAEGAVLAEFSTHGRLRDLQLSYHQRKLVATALTDAFEAAFVTALACEGQRRARRPDDAVA